MNSVGSVEGSTSSNWRLWAGPCPRGRGLGHLLSGSHLGPADSASRNGFNRFQLLINSHDNFAYIGLHAKAALKGSPALQCSAGMAQGPIRGRSRVPEVGRFIPCMAIWPWPWETSSAAAQLVPATPLPNPPPNHSYSVYVPYTWRSAKYCRSVLNHFLAIPGSAKCI